MDEIMRKLAMSIADTKRDTITEEEAIDKAWEKWEKEKVEMYIYEVD